MAISNSIGSNVFDILVGLGLPWALQTLCIDYGSIVSVSSAQPKRFQVEQKRSDEEQEHYTDGGIHLCCCVLKHPHIIC